MKKQRGIKLTDKQQQKKHLIELMQMESINETDLINQSMSNIQNQIEQTLEKAMIEGLRQKGFEFDNRIDLEKFITENCTAIDIPNKKQKTFYVKGEPFFIHYYEMQTAPTFTDNGKELKAFLDFGSYSFL